MAPAMLFDKIVTLTVSICCKCVKLNVQSMPYIFLENSSYMNCFECCCLNFFFFGEEKGQESLLIYVYKEQFINYIAALQTISSQFISDKKS